MTISNWMESTKPSFDALEFIGDLDNNPAIPDTALIRHLKKRYSESIAKLEVAEARLVALVGELQEQEVAINRAISLEIEAKNARREQATAKQPAGRG